MYVCLKNGICIGSSCDTGCCKLNFQRESEKGKKRGYFSLDCLGSSHLVQMFYIYFQMKICCACVHLCLTEPKNSFRVAVTIFSAAFPNSQQRESLSWVFCVSEEKRASGNDSGLLTLLLYPKTDKLFSSSHPVIYIGFTHIPKATQTNNTSINSFSPSKSSLCSSFILIIFFTVVFSMTDDD